MNDIEQAKKDAKDLKIKEDKKKKEIYYDIDNSLTLDGIEKSNASAIENIRELEENKDYIVKANIFLSENFETPYKIKEFFKTNNLLFGEDIDDIINNAKADDHKDEIDALNKREHEAGNNGLDISENEKFKDARKYRDAERKLMKALVKHYKREEMKKNKRKLPDSDKTNKNLKKAKEELAELEKKLEAEGNADNDKTRLEKQIKKKRAEIDNMKDANKINIDMDRMNNKDERDEINEKEKQVDAAEEKRQKDLIEERASEATDMPSIGVKLMPAIPLDVLNKTVDVGTVIDTFNVFKIEFGEYI